jgi:hypothetical protein
MPQDAEMQDNTYECVVVWHKLIIVVVSETLRIFSQIGFLRKNYIPVSLDHSKALIYSCEAGPQNLVHFCWKHYKLH